MLFRKLGNVIFYSFSTLFVVVIISFLVLYHFGRDLPSELTLMDYAPPTTTKVYSSDGGLIEEYAIEHRTIVPFNEIPQIINGAFIIAEDKDFYTHSGVSFKSLLRAIIENTAKKSWNKKPAGGSTITQQIAKNLLVGNARKLSRKIREAIMAFRIEATIPKNRILEIYLNQIYLGKGCYGIAEACSYYFCKKVSEIAPHEAAFLASIPSAPSVYITMLDSTKLLTKRNSILYQMYEFGYINKEQLNVSLSKPIEIKMRKTKFSAPYFSDEVFKMVSQQVSKFVFLSGGYSVKTTLDETIQRCADKALEDGIIEFTKTQPWTGTIGNISDKQSKTLKEIKKQLPSTINKIEVCSIDKANENSLVCKTSNKKTISIQLSDKFYTDAKFNVGDIILARYNDHSGVYELYQSPQITGGIAVMNAKNGDILGMTGGFSFDISSFNCITQAMRQPGSTVKPFVYAAALENGFDENDLIEDKEVTITIGNGEKYTPHNYSGKSYGKTPLRDGLVYSRNLSTVNMAIGVGMQKISKLLSSAGLTKGIVPISAVLGSVETTPLRILSAFSAFSNDGKMVYPRFITEITKNNEPLEEENPTLNLCKLKTKKIMSKYTANTIKNILHDSVLFGTASSVGHLENELGVEIFGKTGTTNDFKDAWFVGAVKNGESTLLISVFIGYPAPKSLGDKKTGSAVALPIFSKFIEFLYKK